MVDETVVIEVKDGVDKSISRNISEISSQARGAYQNVSKLVTQLARVKPTAIAQFSSVVSNAQKQMNSAAITAAKLATEQQKGATAAANASRAQAQAATAATNGARAAAALATSTAQADRAQSAAALAALRLESAQDRAAASARRKAAADDKATASARASIDAMYAQAGRMTANSKELETVTGIHDRYDAVLARSPKYQTAFAKGLAETAAKAKLGRHELTNLSYQVNDVVVSLGSGQRPMQVLLQQGAQIGQIFGSSGVGAGAIFKQLAGIVGSLMLRLAPFAAVIGAVLTPFSLFTRELNKGFDSSKFVNDLKLTEKQLETLKKSGETIGITFGDTFKATFQVIGRYASQFFKPVTDQISQWWNKSLDWMTGATNTFARAMLGLFIGIGNSIKIIFNNIPTALELAIKKAMNAAIAYTESALNIISKAFAMTPVGALLGLGSAEIKLPRLDFSANAKELSDDLSGAFNDGFATADKLVDKFGKDIRAQAQANAKNRILAAAGEADKDKKNKGGGRSFDRAKELASINAELDLQAKNMFVLSTAREAANRADEIALRFAKEGKPLRTEEINALRSKIQALNDAKEVQQQFDRIYQNATGPAREYNATLAAAQKLLDMGAISQARYNAEISRAKTEMEKALDPAKEMLEQVREEVRLLGFAEPLRAKEQQLEQARNAYRNAGLPINEKVIEQLGRELDLLKQKTAEMQLQDNSAMARSAKSQLDTQTAIGQVGQNGFTGGDAITALAKDNPALAQTQEFAAAQVQTYTDMYAQIDALRQADLLSDTSAAMAKVEVFNQQWATQLQGASQALGALSSLQNSENKKQAAIGKKAAIAQALINTYSSATAAFNSLANIPYVGPFLGAAAAAAAVVAGLANVQKIRSTNPGFRAGGYTGDMPTNAVAGNVHGKEYVFDAPATARIGVTNLEALRAGRIPVQAAAGENGSSSTSQTNNGGTIQFNQTVSIETRGRRDRNTPEQYAKAIRNESTRELIRNGG